MHRKWPIQGGSTFGSLSLVYQFVHEKSSFASVTQMTINDARKCPSSSPWKVNGVEGKTLLALLFFHFIFHSFSLCKYNVLRADIFSIQFSTLSDLCFGVVNQICYIEITCIFIQLLSISILHCGQWIRNICTSDPICKFVYGWYILCILQNVTNFCWVVGDVSGFIQ